jgi:hypothetical protein
MAQLQIQRGPEERTLNVSTAGGGGQTIQLAPHASGPAAGAVQIQARPFAAAPPPAAPAAPAAQPPRSRAPPPRPMPPRRELPPPPAYESADESDDDEPDPDEINEFANPSKLRPGAGDDESDDDPSQYDDDDDPAGGDPVDDSPQRVVERPSAGFDTIDDEKADILFKLGRLKRQGIQGLRSGLSVYTDIRELRAELSRVKTEVSLEASIKTQRQILMAVVSSIEFMNKRFDPFDLQLDGWSGHMHENVTDYNSVFEALYHKYRNKVSAPPELQLMLMVGGSALMFHMSNALFKTQMLPRMKASPDTLANVMRAFQPTGPAPPAPPAPPGAGDDGDAQAGRPRERREMRGPGLDIGSVLGGGVAMPPGLFGGGMPSLGNFVPPASSRPRDAAPPPRAAAPQPVSEEPDSPRLSDVPSDDLESVPDDDLSSPGSSESGGVRVVAGRGRGRGAGSRGGGRAAGGKKVVTIL